MLFQPTNHQNNNSSLSGFLPSTTITKPTEKQLHSWGSVEVQNLTKKASRYGHTSTLVGDNLIIIGGEWPDGKKTELLLVKFNLKTQVCEQIPIKGLNARPLLNLSTCYWKDNKFIVFGTRPKEMSSWSEVGILTISETQEAQWELVKANIHLEVRDYHTAHIYQDKMFVIGGVDDNKKAAKDIWYLDLITWQWHKPADWLPPSGFGKVPEEGLPYHSSFLFENKIYVFSSIYKKVAWTIFKVLNLDTLAWEDLKSEGFPTFIRNTKCSQPVNGRVYVLGSDDQSSPSIKLWSYDIRQNLWNEIKQEGKSLAMREEYTINEYENQLYVFGGFNPKGKVTRHDNHTLSTFGCHGLWAFTLDGCQIPEKSQEEKTIDLQGPLTIHQIMKKIVKEAPYSDIVFEVESKEIPAHKWFLIKNSKYFANMFSSGMIESKTSKIPIPDMKASTFESFLEFLYSDDVKLNKDLALELLETADKYSVPDLRVKCEEYLSKNLDMSNYVMVARMADLIDSVTLRKAIIEYMAKWIKLVKARPDFDEISDEYVREIIIKLTVK